MLTKVNRYNYHLGTSNIISYISKFQEILENDFLIQDNMNGHILVKLYDKTFLYNYNIDKYYNHNRIQIQINGYTISKQIDSFDQNNCLIANKIRNHIIKLFSFNDINTILGIGGEYYIYFPFINANNYIGISNHKSIIEDANYNIPFSKNYLVDYNNISTFPKIGVVDNIILNVYNIHDNIIKYIKSLEFKNLIFISCNLSNNKLEKIINNFKIMYIKYFKNIDGLIRIILIKNK
jgi:hypothetical protein